MTWVQSLNSDLPPGRLTSVLRRTLLGTIVALVVLGLASVAQAEELPPGGTFIDDDGSVHEGDIEAIAAEGITTGCDSRGIRFCPRGVVDRGQIAAFIRRALDLPSTEVDYFTDDNNSIFENDINAIAEAGITNGCNPPDNDRYCPNGLVHRDEMASMMARAFPWLMTDNPPDQFIDDETNIHELNINKIAEAGITKGCNPPANDWYCPRDLVTRDQIASFFTRALGLEPNVPPPQKPIERVSRFTTFFNCCEDRVTNIRLMARTIDGYVVMPGEEFSLDSVVGPTTEAKGYLPAGYLINGEGACCVPGGGVSQFGTTIFNAVFWAGYDVGTFRPHTGWLSRYPLGIEHTLIYNSIDFRFTNDTTTPIYIETSSTSTSVTVELWGNQGDWQVVGHHPRGNRSSVISVIDAGSWSEAKRVSATVTGNAPGQVKVVRKLTTAGVTTTETWWWTYVS